jgi:predicted Rossmann fold nucleotide-binding protein DprA/Smf involved in DNA uptake
MKPHDLNFLGNKDILKAHKTAFLCSRKCPADIIVKSYDWAIEQRKNGNCVISCFHSRIEKDVFQILLKGKQPIILALARGMKKRWEPEIKTALEQNRLLIISPFDESVRRISSDQAAMRNRLVLDLADEIRIAHAIRGGTLDTLISHFDDRKIITLF